MKKWFKDLGTAFREVDSTLSSSALLFLIALLTASAYYPPAKFIILFIVSILLICVVALVFSVGVYVLLETVGQTIKNFRKIRKMP